MRAVLLCTCHAAQLRDALGQISIGSKQLRQHAFEAGEGFVHLASALAASGLVCGGQPAAAGQWGSLNSTKANERGAHGKAAVLDRRVPAARGMARTPSRIRQAAYGKAEGEHRGHAAPCAAGHGLFLSAGELAHPAHRWGPSPCLRQQDAVPRCADSNTHCKLRTSRGRGMDSRSSWPLNISNSHASSYARLSAPSLLASHQLAAAAGAITKCSSADTMIRRMSVPFASGRLVGVLGGLAVGSGSGVSLLPEFLRRLCCWHQLGPNRLPVVRAQLTPRDDAARCLLDSNAPLNWHPAFFPVPNRLSRYADEPGQLRRAAHRKRRKLNWMFWCHAHHGTRYV
jgi:hypothetical protein